MAHPFNHLRNHKVQHARVSDITAACGGRMESHGGGVGGGESNKHKSMKKATMRATGGAVKARADRPARAFGGRTKKIGGGKGKKGGKHTVNVIVGGGHPAMPPPMPMARPGIVPGVAGPPPAAPPPAMPPAGAMPPPRPPMPPGPMGAVPGGGPPPGIAPPMIPRKRGGAVFSGTPDKVSKTAQGTVGSNDDTSASAGAGKGRTGIQRSFPTNKQNTQNIGRGAVITKATGGPITSDSKAGTHMGPEFTGGSRGGMAKLEKAAALKRKGYGKPTVTVKNPTQNPTP